MVTMTIGFTPNSKSSPLVDAAWRRVVGRILKATPDSMGKKVMIDW